MIRDTFVMRNGRLVPKRLAAPLVSANQSVSVISDTMAATWHPADGKHYDSKSKFRSVTRAHGCVEIGTEKFAPRKRMPETPIERYREQVQRAIYECENPWAKT